MLIITGCTTPTHQTTQTLDACVQEIERIRSESNTNTPLHERYRDIRIIDIHNHDAHRARKALRDWNTYHIDQTVLFGSISEPAALKTDKAAFKAYVKHPERIYPFFAGVPTYDDNGVAMVQEKLEQGYFGIGEIVGASTYSPVASKLEWKAKHPNDGNLPEIYRLCAQYRTPILLHIDPPMGYPIQMLEQAMTENPGTTFIFAHANAYNSPANIEVLISEHDNLYIDFFAGFNAYNPDATYTLADFVPLIERYPDRFMVSTDSGYDIGYDHAVQAIYEIIDLLSPETACKVASQNFEHLIEAQPPTQTQLARLNALPDLDFDAATLNKRIAHEHIFEND